MTTLATGLCAHPKPANSAGESTPKNTATLLHSLPKTMCASAAGSSSNPQFDLHLVKWHLGLGDAFVFAGLLRQAVYKARGTNFLFLVPVKLHNFYSVSELFDDLKGAVKFQVVDDWETWEGTVTTQQKIHQGAVILHDWTARGNPDVFDNNHWDASMYKAAGVPWSIRYELAGLEGRSISNESRDILTRLNQEAPDIFPEGFECCRSSSYPLRVPVFVHQNSEKPIPPDVLRIYQISDRFHIVEPWKTKSILSWIPIITACPVVICVDSSFANLVEGLGSAGRNMRKICVGAKTPPPTLRLDWPLVLTAWRPEYLEGYRRARVELFADSLENNVGPERYIYGHGLFC